MEPKLYLTQKESEILVDLLIEKIENIKHHLTQKQFTKQEILHHIIDLVSIEMKLLVYKNFQQ